jgi:hypothetical protein
LEWITAEVESTASRTIAPGWPFLMATMSGGSRRHGSPGCNASTFSIVDNTSGYPTVSGTAAVGGSLAAGFLTDRRFVERLARGARGGKCGSEIEFRLYVNRDRLVREHHARRRAAPQKGVHVYRKVGG